MPSTTETDAMEMPESEDDCNAFAIEIAVSDPDHLTSFATLLQAAYGCFPTYEYCILTCPPSVISSELRKYFVKATPKMISNFPHDLFILHRLSTSNNIDVNFATDEDLDDIVHFASKIIAHKRLLRYVKFAFNENLRTFKIIKCTYENLLLGLAIIRPMTLWKYICFKYELEMYGNLNELTDDQIGVIEYLILSPAFANNGDFFIREILRLTNYDALCYMLHIQELDLAKVKRSYNCIFGKDSIFSNTFTCLNMLVADCELFCC